METDFDVRGRIKRSGYRLGFVAASLGITYASLKNKLDGKREFKAGEISKMSRLLNLSPQECVSIFFKQ